MVENAIKIPVANEDDQYETILAIIIKDNNNSNFLQVKEGVDKVEFETGLFKLE